MDVRLKPLSPNTLSVPESVPPSATDSSSLCPEAVVVGTGPCSTRERSIAKTRLVGTESPTLVPLHRVAAAVRTFNKTRVVSVLRAIRRGLMQNRVIRNQVQTRQRYRSLALLTNIRRNEFSPGCG